MWRKSNNWISLFSLPDWHPWLWWVLPTVVIPFPERPEWFSWLTCLTLHPRHRYPGKGNIEISKTCRVMEVHVLLLITNNSFKILILISKKAFKIIFIKLRPAPSLESSNIVVLLKIWFKVNQRWNCTNLHVWSVFHFDNVLFFFAVNTFVIAFSSTTFIAGKWFNLKKPQNAKISILEI